jgi:hypothetical protein
LSMLGSNVPIYEAFGPSLLTAEMSGIYEGKAGRSRGDTILANVQSIIPVIL